ncbi:hypothetical protein L7F22_064161 [Adiantum nelumboides]|nr:hypothetical protein [Adiantum nelumboides]
MPCKLLGKGPSLQRFAERVANRLANVVRIVNEATKGTPCYRASPTLAGNKETSHKKRLPTEVISVDDESTHRPEYVSATKERKQVQAGTDVIITQLFYDVELFLKFRNDCQEIGITCPIIPVIMPVHSYRGFKRFTRSNKTKIPADIHAALELVKADDKAVKAFGVHLGVEMCKNLLIHGVKHIHIYTLNKENSAIDILRNLRLIDITTIRKRLPWRHPRAKEIVRPIFWANRPRSYIRRTHDMENWSPRYRAYSVYTFARRQSRDKSIQEEWVIPLRGIEAVQEGEWKSISS